MKATMIFFVVPLIVLSSDHGGAATDEAPPLAATDGGQGKCDTNTFMKLFYCYDPYFCATHIPFMLPHVSILVKVNHILVLV
ncbi:hypothetical protein TSUD_233780 [Trifolium subterraneum]|uniref:Uncharacterized protein n=1 Tax=Trifolium subterraneum TaxID=3900 RepID=A0A2Z6MJS2_TRISU|nr:hypothetical protein TSUD_233780 [Trifolium subterraneum]